MYLLIFSLGLHSPQVRMFHTSRALLMLADHPLFNRVDWVKVRAGQFCVVDPIDPSSVLYLSERDYKLQIRVSISQDSPLIVLARPGESPPSSPASTSTNSSNSPHSGAFSGATKSSWRMGPAWTSDPEHSPEQHAAAKIAGGVMPPRRGFGTGLDGKPIQFYDSLSMEGNLVSTPRREDHWKFLNWYKSRLAKYLSVDKSSGDSLVTPSGEVLKTLILGWGVDLTFRSGGPTVTRSGLQKALLRLGQDLTRILETRGPQALILKMKNTLFFMNKWLGGVSEPNPFLLGEPVGLARSGLPRIIPLYFRRLIAQRHIPTIRVMEGILKSYSALKGQHAEQDLSSVIGPHPSIPTEYLEGFQVFCRDIFWPKVMKSYLNDKGMLHLLHPDFLTDEDSPLSLPQRGGPNASVAILGAPLDSLAWDLCPVNWPMEWARHVGDERTIRLFEETILWAKRGLSDHNGRVGPVELGTHKKLVTSKLGLIPEPAGKVRTIAIVDYWTQRVMKPVHDWMMRLLSALPADGTFNQEEALESYARQCAVAGVVTHHSIDLKSATDLIPIALYEALFKGLLDEVTVDLWIHVLTDRWFLVPESDLVVESLHNTEVQYGRGQPMGTLSSWASMALVHHALELYSAHRAGLDPVSFTTYRVLGDDNVTGNTAVAAMYRQVCVELHVPFSPSKTLDGKLLIFASRVRLEGEDISPLSLKEELGVKSFSQRLEAALRAYSRGYTGDKPSVARFLRLLIPRVNYVHALDLFSKGRLGCVVQTALVSAFGVAGRLLARLGLRSSGSKPFLLALQDKVEALAGDQGQLDSNTAKSLQEIELLLAISTVRNAIGMLRGKLNKLNDSRIRYTEWMDAMEVHDLLPLSWRKGPKSWILNLPERGFVPPREELAPGRRVLRSYYRALWPIIVDSYAPFLGVMTHDSDQFDYDQVMANDLGFSSEEPGMSIIYSPDPSTLVSAGGVSTAIPGIVQETAEAIQRATDVLNQLVKATSDSELVHPFGGPWELVDEIFDLIAKLPSIPEFYTLGCLSPSRSPKDIDLLRSWVRQVSAYNEVLRHLPLQCNFDVATVEPSEGGFSEWEDAVSQTSAHVLRLVRKGKRGSPRASQG